MTQANSARIDIVLSGRSQPHNAASVPELSRSLEVEHEFRREVTLQVMRWFGQVDNADERRRRDVEKVVRQVGLGILRSTGLISSVFFFRPQPFLV
jgi:sister chromatid cohesion protein DCC1